MRQVFCSRVDNVECQETTPCSIRDGVYEKTRARLKWWSCWVLLQECCSQFTEPEKNARLEKYLKNLFQRYRGKGIQGTCAFTCESGGGLKFTHLLEKKLTIFVLTRSVSLNMSWMEWFETFRVAVMIISTNFRTFLVHSYCLAVFFFIPFFYPRRARGRYTRKQDIYFDIGNYTFIHVRRVKVIVISKNGHVHTFENVR